MPDRLWVVEWNEDGIRHRTATWCWKSAIRHAFEMAGLWGGPARVMSEATYLGGDLDG